MKVPVVAADGHTYEKCCIEEWLATGKGTSPITNEPFSHSHLIANHTVKSLIVEFLAEAREIEAALGDEVKGPD